MHTLGRLAIAAMLFPVLSCSGPYELQSGPNGTMIINKWTGQVKVMRPGETAFRKVLEETTNGKKVDELIVEMDARRTMNVILFVTGLDCSLASYGCASVQPGSIPGERATRYDLRLTPEHFGALTLSEQTRFLRDGGVVLYGKH